MALLFQIEGATRLDDGIWKARLSQSEIRLLDPKAESAGDITVLLLLDEPTFDPERSQLAFDPSKVKLLNAGISDNAILVGNASKVQPANRAKTPTPSQLGSGDAKFLSALPSQLRELGTALLVAVRSKYRGDLVFYEASGKYVEAPDNFWTIRPQPRDESFRVTVRGRPESFESGRTLELKPDMTGYSSFKIERMGQIEELIRVLAQVRRR